MSFAPADLSAAVDYVEKVRQGLLPAQNLVALLAEQSPFLQLVGASEVERFRGYVLATFGMVGLPASARDIVQEELETGTEPYTVAAAAMALVGAVDHMQHAVDLLETARLRVIARDVHVQYQHFEAAFDVNSCDTVSGIINDAIRLLSSRPSQTQNMSAAIENSECCCCAGDNEKVSHPKRGEPRNHILEDQTGARTSFGEYFCGRLGVLTFFYTRCMNPEKCSLTISNLARLQRALAARNLDDHVRIGAISYDPAYDLPYRLAAYGRERGLIFGEGCRMLRSPDGFKDMRENFELGVGFGPQTVNRHQIELFLLDQNAVPFKRFARMKWDVNDLVRLLEVQIGPATGQSHSPLRAC